MHSEPVTPDQIGGPAFDCHGYPHARV